VPELGAHRELKRSQLALDQSFGEMLIAERAREPSSPALQSPFNQFRSADRGHFPGQLCN